jgi:hypothetical protein
MVFEKVILKLDVSKAEEDEFLSNFIKEYDNEKDYLNKSFMARMQEDIRRRRMKDQNLHRVGKEYRKYRAKKYHNSNVFITFRSQ